MKAYVLDSFLHRPTGHHDHLARVFKAAEASFDCEFILLGHRSARSDLLGLPVVPVFRRDMYNPLSRDPYDHALTDVLFGQLEYAADLQDLSITEEDLVILPTLTIRELAGVLLWISRNGAHPKIIGVVHRAESLGSADLSCGSIGGALVRNVTRELFRDHPGKVWFGATTPELVQELAGPAAGPVHLVAGQVSFAADLRRRPKPGTGATIGFLGGARADKGSPLAFEIADALCLRHPEVDCIVQHHSSDEPPALSPSERRASERVRLVSGWLPPEAFTALFQQTDLLVLPYDQTAFRTAASGIFSHAIAAGIPAAVPAGTTMAAAIARGEAAGLTFDSVAFETVVSAVERTLPDLPRLTELAAEKAVSWRAKHSAETFIEHIMTWAGVSRRPTPRPVRDGDPAEAVFS